MPDPRAIRKMEDLKKIKALQERMQGVLEIANVVGDPPRSITLWLRIPTAKDRSYPRERQENNQVELRLPENYPFPPGPMVYFKTPIWNPNVNQSFAVSFGKISSIRNLKSLVDQKDFVLIYFISYAKIILINSKKALLLM
jgi:ubiquitin-protein ligase